MPGPQNKSITVQGNTAAVSALFFRRTADGTLHAQVIGSVQKSDGGTDRETLELIIPNGSLKTQIVALMDGAALTQWRAAYGLEAP